MQIMSVFVSQDEASIADLARRLDLDYARTEWQHRDPGLTSDWQHTVPSEQLWWDTYVVQTGSLAEARSLLPMLRGEGRARRLVLVISGRPPAGGNEVWTAHSLQVKARTSAMTVPGVGFAVTIVGGKWVNIHAAAVAALRCCSEAAGRTVLKGLRVGITEASASPWIAGDIQGSFMTGELLEPDQDDIYSVDVVVGSAELADLPGRQTPAIWPLSGEMLPPVDTAIFSPMGFLPIPDKPAIGLEPESVGNRLHLTETDVAALRRHDYLIIDGARFRGLENVLARRMTQLAVAGVPMLVSGLSPALRSLVEERLVERIEAFTAGDSHLLRESKSIDMRRSALELYGPTYRWNNVLSQLDRPLAPLPTVSVLLASRRPDKLESAFAQLGRQSWTAVEVVLALHGVNRELPEVKRAIASYPGEVTVCSLPSTMVFGNVLNHAVSAASGDLVSKIDDDDWYGEHHIRDLVHAKEYSGATLVGAQVEFVYLESLDITTRRPPSGERFSDHVAGGTMTIGRDDLRELGGWRPVHRAVDRCLLQTVHAAGGLVYRSHGQSYLMHRHSNADSHGGHTWNPDDSVFLQSVAEQWDGFRPPPQIDVQQMAPAAVRHSSLRSHFTES